MAKKVEYSKDRIDVRAADLPLLEMAKAKKFPQKMLVTKSKHWEYESEIRMLMDLSECIQEGELHFRRFGTDLILAEVILGDLCTLNNADVKTIASALKSPPLTFSARLAGKSYAVVPDGNKV